MTANLPTLFSGVPSVFSPEYPSLFSQPAPFELPKDAIAAPVSAAIYQEKVGRAQACRLESSPYPISQPLLPPNCPSLTLPLPYSTLESALLRYEAWSADQWSLRHVPTNKPVPAKTTSAAPGSPTGGWASSDSIASSCPQGASTGSVDSPPSSGKLGLRLDLGCLPQLYGSSIWTPLPQPEVSPIATFLPQKQVDAPASWGPHTPNPSQKALLGIAQLSRPQTLLHTPTSSHSDLLTGISSSDSDVLVSRSPAAQMAVFAQLPTRLGEPSTPSDEDKSQKLNIGEPCVHEKFWSRIRSKKGYNHFVCELCNAKWRIMTNKRRRQEGLPLQMH